MDTLPMETVVHIASYLRSHDLRSFLQASTALHSSLKPLLYNDIAQNLAYCACHQEFRWKKHSDSLKGALERTPDDLVKHAGQIRILWTKLVPYQGQCPDCRPKLKHYTFVHGKHVPTQLFPSLVEMHSKFSNLQRLRLEGLKVASLKFPLLFLAIASIKLRNLKHIDIGVEDTLILVNDIDKALSVARATETSCGNLEALIFRITLPYSPRIPFFDIIPWLAAVTQKATKNLRYLQLEIPYEIEGYRQQKPGPELVPKVTNEEGTWNTTKLSTLYLNYGYRKFNVDSFTTETLQNIQNVHIWLGCGVPKKMAQAISVEIHRIPNATKLYIRTPYSLTVGAEDATEQFIYLWLLRIIKYFSNFSKVSRVTVCDAFDLAHGDSVDEAEIFSVDLPMEDWKIEKLQANAKGLLWDFEEE